MLACEHRVRGGRRRVAVPGRRARRLLADQPAAAPGQRRAGRVAGRGGGRAGQERGRDAAGHAARAARPGLPRRADRHRGRRRQLRRHRRGRRADRGRGGPAAAGDLRRPAAGRRALGRQGVGHGPGPARGRSGPLRGVHRRRHRLGGAHAAPPGGRGRGRRPGPGLADGPAAHGHRLGARRGPRLRLLLRPALPVPAGERARLADGRRGGRLHAHPPRRPGERRAAWRRSAAPSSTTWPWAA